MSNEKNFLTQSYRASVTNHGLPNYPESHKVGMRVPHGGSNCQKCEYVDGQKCRNEHFVEWLGSNRIPAPVAEYCCDFFESSKRYA
jgi:hypothetical protein